MIKKKTILLFLLTTLIIAGLGLGLLVKSADFVNRAFQKTLINNGFEITKIEKIEKRVGAIRYHNITLGTEEKSSIDLLEISYNPLKFNKLKSIKIHQIFVSGELDINGKLTLQGIKNIETIFANAKRSPETLSLQNINISLLSAQFGGIRATANLSGQRSQDHIAWTGNVDSKQDQLEIIAKINGQTNTSGTWVIDFEIENAKLERTFGKITRAHGSLSWNGKDDQWTNLHGELNAGGLIAYNTPWQNASFSIEKTPQSPTEIRFSGKSSGAENLEIAGTANISKGNMNWDTVILASTGKAAINYLNNHGYIPFDTEILTPLSDKKEVSIILEKTNNILKFNVEDMEEKIDVIGKAVTTGKKDSVAVKTKLPDLKELRLVTCRKDTCRFNVIQKDGYYKLSN